MSFDSISESADAGSFLKDEKINDESDLKMKGGGPNEKWQSECAALPNGWIREDVIRKGGLLAGKFDVYVDVGKKVRSKPVLGDTYDLSCFDYSSGTMQVKTPKKESPTKTNSKTNTVRKNSEECFVPVIILSAIGDDNLEELVSIVSKLGGVITDSPRHCTHLLMGQLNRTDKFLQCLPGVSFVLRSEWLLESKTAGTWVEENGFMITNPDMEARFGFNLERTLARKNRDKLFIGKTFYLTPNVKPGIKVLTNMVELSGGR